MTGTVSSVTDISALAAISPFTPGQTVIVAQRGAADDGYTGAFIALAGDHSADVTADPQKGIWVAPSTASSGSSGAWKRVYSGPIQLSWFGAGWTAAYYSLSYLNHIGGGVLLFPLGTTTITIPMGSHLFLSANTTLAGLGSASTTVVIQYFDDRFNAMSMLGANVSFVDMTIQFVPDSGLSCQLIYWNYDNLSFNRCKINGTMVASGGTVNHRSIVVIIPTVASTQNNLSFTNCEITGVTYTTLKDNTATSIQNNIIVDRCHFHGNYLEDMAYNSPNGQMNNMVVSNCVFDTPLRITSTDYRIAIGMFGTGATCINNVINGDFNDAIHVEENTSDMIISGNTGTITGNAIFLVSNNVGTSGDRQPVRTVVSNNRFEYTGTADSKGMYLVWDGSGRTPIKDSIVSDNIMKGFPTGFLNGILNGSASDVSNNVCVDCAVGYFVVQGGNLMRNNTSLRCTTGVKAVGAILEGHTFVDCPTTLAVNGAYPVYCYDPKFVFYGSGVVPTSTSVSVGTIIPLTSTTRVDFTALRLSLRSLALATSNCEVREIYSWNGTAETKSTPFSYSLGTFQIAAAKLGTNLVVTATDTGNHGSVCQVEAQAEGLMIFQ